jgi:hypothetical protein
MLLGSNRHTVGDTRRWRLDYSRWLDNAVAIVDAEVTSSSPTCTVDTSSISGNEIVFFLSGGALGETLTVTVVMTDSVNNVKHDTIAFTVVAQ